MGTRISAQMSSTITQLLQEWKQGNEQALDRLIPLVYDQLRLIAIRQLNNEADITLQPTELVHEAFLRIMNSNAQSFRDRVHFYGAISELMKRILIDLSRRRAAAKRGATLLRVELHDNHLAHETGIDAEALDRAMRKLGALDPRQAQIVNLRFFGGLSNPEVAELMQISESTVKRDWAVAKAWLMRECGGTA